jgi:hypothetical protein
VKLPHAMMFMSLVIATTPLLFSLSSTTFGNTITVFRNTLFPTEFGTKGGAILINASKIAITETDKATICFRFNFKVLAI